MLHKTRWECQGSVGPERAVVDSRNVMPPGSPDCPEMGLGSFGMPGCAAGGCGGKPADRCVLRGADFGLERVRGTRERAVGRQDSIPPRDGFGRSTFSNLSINPQQLWTRRWSFHFKHLAAEIGGDSRTCAPLNLYPVQAFTRMANSSDRISRTPLTSTLIPVEPRSTSWFCRTCWTREGYPWIRLAFGSSE